MFSINSKKHFPITSIVTTDMHAHLLPGLDDGAVDLSTSVGLVSGLSALGYRTLVATPHVISKRFRNTPEAIAQAAAKLQQALEDRGIPITLQYAAEYMVDPAFENLINTGELLTLPGNHVLIETTHDRPPTNWKSVLFELQTTAYHPILAHPERYLYIDRKLLRIEHLRDRGCLFQVDILSLAGNHGTRARNIATRMLESGFVDFLGTNLHNEKQLHDLQHFTVTAKIAKLLEKIALKNDAFEPKGSNV